MYHKIASKWNLKKSGKKINQQIGGLGIERVKEIDLHK